MTTIAIDGLSEEEFRRSIESGLRRGRADEAVAKLRELIEPFAGDDRILPHRFLTVDSADLELVGWEGLKDRIRRYDRPGRLVTAISIAFGWPGEDVPQPDAEGRVSPLVEIGYYNDDAFPFSRSGREDLLDGYSFHGCTWGDDCVGSDNALALEGISDLHGALAALEAQLLASDEPDPDAICAGSLGACLLSALLYQAVAEKVAEAGLPRALCVMAGSNGVYPYFDAPVTGMPMDVLKAARADDEEDNPFDTGVPGPRYSSLVMTGIKRAPKRAVLVLEESEEDMAVRIANLRGLAHGQGDAASPVPLAPIELPEVAATPPAEECIVDSPISPLMTKKASGHGWDFRDMLSPRDPESPGEPSEGAVPDFDDWDEPAPEPESNADHWNEPEHDAASEPERDEIPERAIEPVRDEPVEPGFSLVEVSLQERLQSLLASPVVPLATEPESIEEPEPADAVSLAAAEVPLAATVDEVTVPHWPLGLGWLEEDEPARPEAPALNPEQGSDSLPAEPRPSLWARIGSLLSALRRKPPAPRSRKLRP
ncbi:MAG: hypothetical protein RL299_119 [Pseudomonadota bacterium]